MSDVSVQPAVETLPPRTSTATTTRAAKRAIASSSRSRSRKAAVPRMTRCAPASTAAWTASIERSPPPYWTGTPSRGDLREVVERARLAVAGAVEVDDVQVGGAGLDPVARGLQRRVGVHRLVLEAALDEPHRAALLDVDGGIEDHADDEVLQQREPVPGGLLRVELRAEDGAGLDDGRERLAVRRGPDDDRLVGGPDHEGVHVVEGHVAEPGGDLRGLRAHEVPADVRQPLALRVKTGDVALEQPQAGRAAVLGRGLEQQLHPEADAQRRDARRARSRSSSVRPSASRRSIAAGNAPTPGMTMRSAAAISSWSCVTTASAPTCSNAFSTERRLPIP